MSAPFQVMPDLSPDEYADLKEDIRINGITVPVVFDRQDRVVDGHHRMRIAEELGLDTDDVPWVLATGETDDELRNEAYRLNAHRRHLSREQKRAALELSLKANPGLSDRQHAERVGVDHKTAGAVRDRLVETGEIPQSETRVSRDGRERPATQPFREPAPAVPLDRYPELQHYADRPEKAATLAAALDGYDDDERAVRREALAATIAAEQRNGGPVSYLQRDLDIEKADALFVTASQAVRAIQTAGGPGLLARVADRMDPLTRDGWAQTYTALAEHARAMAVAITSPSHLRSVQ